MDDKERADKQRGDDAQDHAPHATSHTAPAGEKQEAENYRERAKGGGSIEVEDLSSANDEGAP